MQRELSLKYPDDNPKTITGVTKPDLSLIPPVALIEEALAFQDGAKKYGPYNWRDKKVSSRIYTAAAMRHILSWQDGEECDPISSVHHLAHARACLAILLDASSLNQLNDNRSFGVAAEMIRESTISTSTT